MPHPHSCCDAPTPSEGCVAPAPAPAVADTITNTRELFRMGINFNCALALDEEEFKALTKNFIYDDDEGYHARVVHGYRSISEMGTIIDVFDAKHMDDPKYGGDPVPVLDFKKDRPLVDRLTKCANLAIADYNLKKKTNYRFVKFEMAVWQPVAGVLYYITFQARNAKKNYKTFEATVFTDRSMRKVVNFRMKESNTWYTGTLCELIN